MFSVNGPGFLPATRAFPTPTYTLAPLSNGLSEKLRDYTLIKKLGEGAFGDVWLAGTTFGDDERALVAVKAVRRSKIDSTDPVMRDELEITNLLTEFDPGYGLFPQLVESFTDENNYYIVQEFIPGGTLRDEIERRGGKIPLDRAKCVIAQLITTLVVLHNLGVIHRDLKPENILIDAGGNVVLADMGLARRVHGLEVTPEGIAPALPFLMPSDLSGTRGYMAPEVIMEEYYCFPVDLYSVGVIFFEMVFGVLPFPQLELRDQFCAMMNYDFSRSISALPVDAADLMFKLLRNMPQRRITLYETMTHPFFSKINWTLASRRAYALPDDWAPPIVANEPRMNIDKRVLVDLGKGPMPYGRRRLSPLDREFVTPRRVPTAKRPRPVQKTLSDRSKRVQGLRVLGEGEVASFVGQAEVDIDEDEIVERAKRPDADEVEDDEIVDSASGGTVSPAETPIETPAVNNPLALVISTAPALTCTGGRGMPCAEIVLSRPGGKDPAYFHQTPVPSLWQRLMAFLSVLGGKSNLSPPITPGPVTPLSCSVVVENGGPVLGKASD